MRTIMEERSNNELSLSLSRRRFQWIMGKVSRDQSLKRNGDTEESNETLRLAPSASSATPPAKKTPYSSAASRIRSALAAAIARKTRLGCLGPRVTGTLFGHRRGHVRIAFQADLKSSPAVLIELATPTGALVREMASGLARIALECERESADGSAGGGARRLLEEPRWRAYCNGKNCGPAVRRECGPSDWKVLKAVEPVSMGAGVLPGDGGAGEGEMMYMRASFERVVGSKDSEAFYMINPDSHGGSELSIYLLRV